MKPHELIAMLAAKKADQAKAKDEWKNADKPGTATVKSLDARLKAVEKLLGLIVE